MRNFRELVTEGLQMELPEGVEFGGFVNRPRFGEVQVMLERKVGEANHSRTFRFKVDGTPMEFPYLVKKAAKELAEIT